MSTRTEDMSTPEERVAARMKRGRIRAELSQEDAARKLKVALRTYARWERGETMGFVGHLAQIAAAFSTTPDDLLGGEMIQPDLAPSVEELSGKVDRVMVMLEELTMKVDDLSRSPKK